VTRATPTAPEEDCAGAWLVASPTTAGKFSAVGWFFGKRIAAETGAPVGLIASYWGGTAVEPWISATAFDPDPELKARTGQMLRDITSLPQRTEDYARLYPAWTEKHGRQDNRVGSTADYTGPEVDTANWRKVRMPLRFTDAGLPDAGAVWLRRSIKLPVKPGNLAVQSSVIVDLGKAGQFDEVYWNGEKIGETSPTIANFANRAYTVPAKLPKDGVNVLAVRIHAPAGGGGLLDPQALFRVRLTDGVVELAGDWLAKVEYELPPLTATARAEYPPQPEKIALRDSPTLLFNGMINPLIPYGMRGVIWYQGESNVDRAQQYRSAFPLLIRDWRAQWGRGDFPFYFCQLANYRGIQKEPGNSPWAELREAQDRTLTVPNTGMAVLIDIGEEWDIHPRNKGDVGGRLALIALHHTYGKQNMEFSGPRFESVKFDGNRAAVKFTHANGGLVAKPLLAEYQPVSLQSKKMPLVRNTPDSEVEGFAICGEDRQWKWADAKIAGDTVIVSAAGVEKPVAVRYAWGNNPMCNLYNQAGLPAAPFRTDNFPGVTDGKKY
jgi:sialate O-acetylesterase